MSFNGMLRMRMSVSVAIALVVLAVGVDKLFAGSRLVWEGEAEAVIRSDWMRYGAAAVDDPLASGGKAVRIPWQKEAVRRWSVQVMTPELTLQGKCLFTLHVRAEGMLPISHGLKATLVAHDKATGQWAHSATWFIYGINLKPEGYTALTLPLETSKLPTTYRAAAVMLEWTEQPDGVRPTLFLDRMEIRTPAYDAPVITEVWPGKVRYAPGDRASVRITVFNPTDQDVQVTLRGEDRTGLTARRTVFTQRVVLKAKEEKALWQEWRLGKEEYGHEIAVTMLRGEEVVDTASELFTVCETPLWLSTGNGYDRGTRYRDMHTVFYVAPATAQDTWRSVQFFKKLCPGGEYREFFSWSPGDISDLAPEEEVFPGGEGRLCYRSRETIRQQIAMLKSVGFWPVSYVNGTCWADSGYKLFARHPEWFLYDSNGEVAHYEMDSREVYRHKDDADFDPNTYPKIFFQGTLNHALPEVQEYIARQFVKCGKEMGFKGVRMDVRYLEVHPGERNFYGEEVVSTHEEADRISAAAIKRVKELVHRELPDFTFGYNICAPEETKNMPLTMRERCAGGGWMLDEVPCTYQSKTSPYHVWEAYVKRMVSWGDQVNKWGGIYNPFDFRRGGARYVVDNIYSSIFRLIAGGRFNCYHNSRLPFGNLGRFATRYGEFFFGKNRSWIPDPKGEVEVKTAAPLWWKDMVFWNRDQQGRRQLIVNLVNPPMASEVEENPLSEIRPPVRDIQVVCAKADGKAPQAAYLLAAEPMEPTGNNEVRMMKLPMKSLAGGKVSVRVPSVLFWKMIVFQY